MPIKVNMHEARTKLSLLGEKAWAGEKVIITRNGKPYLELRPYATSRVRRKPGRLAGKIHMTADFDQTSGEVMDTFEGHS